MNTNVVQRYKQHDYSFISKLLGAIFDDATLQNATASDRSMAKTAYARLDDDKYDFITSIFRERVGNDNTRYDSLPKLINMRCSAVRQRVKKRN